MLEHGLRGESFRDVGESIPVVEDPAVPGRLIPAEFAGSRGPAGMLRDNVPLALGWISLVGFLGWAFIPRELAALAEAVDAMLRRGSPGPGH